LSIWQWIKPDVVILGIPAQSMENHRHAAKEDSPAFAGKECDRFLSSHFRDQAFVERSTLSEIASASASERGFSTHGSLLLLIAVAGSGLPFLNLKSDRRSE
jgi:hypothetical protein